MCVGVYRIHYWQQAPWVTPQEAALLIQSPGGPQQPRAAPSNATEPARHILEIGDPGDGSLTADNIPQLAPPARPPHDDGSVGGDNAAREPPEDVLATGAEALLLRAAAANAGVQLGGLPHCCLPFCALHLGFMFVVSGYPSIEDGIFNEAVRW